MKEETKYSYQKRIGNLSDEIERLRCYRRICGDVYEALTTMVQEGRQINQGWLLKKFSEVWK